MSETTHNPIRRWEPRELSAATIKRKEDELLNNQQKGKDDAKQMD